jgi:hypothetical protein
MATFSLTFCTFPAKDFLAATVNVRGRWRPLGRKMSSLGTRINSQVGQWSKELSWNYKDKEFYLSYFIVLWLRMWFNYYSNAVYCSQGQGKSNIPTLRYLMMFVWKSRDSECIDLPGSPQAWDAPKDLQPNWPRWQWHDHRFWGLVLVAIYGN